MYGFTTTLIGTSPIPPDGWQILTPHGVTAIGRQVWMG